MLNAIKVSVLLFIFAVSPITSNAWADQYSRHDDHMRHRHDYHAHDNPDLTLVSGMDYIDSRVLVDPAPDPDPAPEVVYQPVVEAAAPAPSQVINSDTGGNYIVNVPNNAGGFTPVRIQKYGNGYVGPQGEFYYPFPEVTQLKAMYGI